MRVLAQSALVLAFSILVDAHMEMTWPPPLKSKANPFNGGEIDHDMTSPLLGSGTNFPCKGYLSLLGSEAAQPVVAYEAGQSYNLTIGGGANHGGGSCQASLSFDGGQTFTVIKSYIGGCPPQGTSNYDFTIPNDVPSADDAIFAWTWFNQIGNREMYMNCAVVSTSGGGSAKRQSSAAFTSRPKILVANVDNDCETLEGSDVAFPDPGPDVVEETTGALRPEGRGCAKGGNGGGDGGGPGNDLPDNGTPDNGTPDNGTPDSATPSTTTAPVADVPGPTASSPASQQPDETTTLPGGIFLPQPSAGASTRPTTLSTITTSSSTDAANSESTPSPTEVPETPRPPTGAQTPGTRCDSEGEWNCVGGGSQFQRCAAGLWSTVMAMAEGTSCEVGFSQTLVWVKKRGARRRRSAL